MIIYQSSTLCKICFTKTREKSDWILTTWLFLRITEINTVYEFSKTIYAKKIQIFAVGFGRGNQTTQILSTTQYEPRNMMDIEFLPEFSMT